eukprot:572498-Rhodomonas_salina.1
MANKRQKVLSKYNKEAREALPPPQHQTWTKRQQVPTVTAHNPPSGAGTGQRKLRAKVTLAELTSRQPTDSNRMTTRTATATTAQTTLQTATTQPRPRKEPDSDGTVGGETFAEHSCFGDRGAPARAQAPQ